METIHWIIAHGHPLLEDTGIIASLLFTAAAYRKDERSRQISNQLALTAEHRDIWTAFYERPELKRVLEPKLDLQKHPITNEEALFITFLLMHLSATYRAREEGMFRTHQAIEKDIKWFLSLPIPNMVWRKSKDFLEPDLVKYVDGALNGTEFTRIKKSRA